MSNAKSWHRETLIATIIITMLLGVCAVCTAETSSQEAGDSDLINIDVRDAPIQQVLQMLAKAANVNILIGENVSGRVQAVSLRDVTVESALRLIATTKGYYWYRDGNVYIVTAEKPADSESSAPSTVSQPPQEEEASTTPSSSASRGTPATATDRSPEASDTTRTSTDSDGPPLVRSENATVTTSQGDGEPPLITRDIKVKYKDAGTLALAFGGEIAGGNVAHARYGRSPRPSELRDSMRYTPQAFSGPDTLGGGASSSAMGQDIGGGTLGGGLGGRTSSTGTSRTGTTGRSGGMDSMLPGEMEPPIAYMPENALIVRGTQDEIDKFVSILEMLDKPTRQVEIYTKFVEIQTTAQEALGIDWTVSNGSLEFWNLGFQPGAAVQNVIRWGRGRFNAQLAALSTNGRATVINEPHVTCHNNEMGEVSFITTIPYYTSTNEYNQFGQRVRGDTEWEEVEVENSLYVMPRINADDTVTMSLSPMLADQVGEVVGPDGSSYPIITEQEVYTSVTVQDGESIVMGGLIRKDNSVTHQETPLLSKLPVIGKLFRSKSYKTSNSELLIFVTPKIVRDVPAQ